MKRRSLISAVVICGLVLTWCGSRAVAGTECDEPVSTGQGLIRGLADPDYAACVWKGIPYAAAPVGELRWRAPEPPPAHEGVFAAVEYGFACPQDESLTSGGEAKGFSEDCLTLSVWRPKKDGRFPVMYWIHGGAFRQGSGTYEMSDGARLAAERDVVVVDIDYRLGVLGFLALPELKAEDPHGSAGNWGFLDMVQGLKWVQANIAGFGGDPGNVTIFGQSAGGMSVCMLLASPLAQGLFHRAISMSGSCEMATTLDQAYQVGETYAQELKCDGPERLACLRSKTTDEVVGNYHNLVLTSIKGNAAAHVPNLDGYALVDSPINCIREGKFNQVPVMLGHTRDEVRLYTMIMPGVSLWSRSLVNRLMLRLFGEPLTEKVKELYSYSDYRHPAQLILNVANDAFISTGYVAAEELSRQVPTYLYRFDWDDTRFKSKMGAFHGLDEPLVFGALEMDSRLAKLLANKKAVASGEPLSEDMMSYYTNFARAGDPNGDGLPAWPQYDTAAKQRIYLDNPITVSPISELELKRYQLLADYNLMDRAF